ncbi:type II secretion system protein [Bacillaceae bacterium IKA-2]|nr:type II secretion system protein [Bacillaceae bacterium IKA-2]
MKMSKNETGMTLIELLVVIVILGIIAGIAIISFSTIIQKSKDNAFVANAYTLKEAAEKYYLSSGSFTDESALPLEIPFEVILTSGFIEVFKDPDTSEMMPVSGNGTFVEINNQAGALNYYICYQGDERQLCDEDGKGILFQDLNISLIR